MTTVVQLLVVLGIMVLVHEFGHFAVAKLCGIRVEVFAIGFGRRLVGFRHGDTDYRLCALPLGGYVKMAGDTPGEAATGDPGDFNSHPRWQRVLIALAGPIANFLLAFALMAGVYMLHNEVDEYLSSTAVADYVSPGSPVARTGIHNGDTIVHFDKYENPTWDQVYFRSVYNLNRTVPFSFVHDGHRTDTTLLVASDLTADKFTPDALGFIPLMQKQSIEVTDVLPGMPAQQSGLQVKDRILTIDGLALHSVPALLAYLQDQAGKPVTLLVERTGADGTSTVPLRITPQLSDIGDGSPKKYRLGFDYIPPPVKVERLPLGKAFAASWAFNRKNSLLIFEVLRGMFTRHISVKSLSGPIGIGQQVHEAASMPGWMPLIGIMAYISINLGIFNLLPIPILDGGMILFLLIESLLRREIDQQIKERVYQVAFVCIVLFATMVIFNDITKLLPTHLKT